MAEDGVEEGMLLSLRIKCMNASMTIFYEDIFQESVFVDSSTFLACVPRGRQEGKHLLLTESWIAVVLSEVAVFYRGFH